MGDDRFKDKIIEGKFLTLSIFIAGFLAYNRVSVTIAERGGFLYFMCDHGPNIDELLDSFRENKTLRHFVKSCRDMKKMLVAETKKRQARGSS